MSEQHLEREQRVTPLELFFDLVFVFAFTQVTTVLADDPTWAGLGYGLLILGTLWWAWAAYAWLTNTVDPGEETVWGGTRSSGVAPVALVVPALVALTLVAVVWVALHAYEIIWWRDARAQTRALRLLASA